MSWIDKKRIEYEERFLKLLNNKKINNNLYQIPEHLKIAETPSLQKDRNQIYKIMNNKFNKEFGEKLQELYEKDSDKYYIGIHRTMSGFENVFKNGIVSRGTWIHDHVQIMKNFPFLLHQLSVADSYKGSFGSFIVKIPKKDIDPRYESSEERDPIFYKSNDITYVRPEYIVGYVPVNDGNLNEFIPNDFPAKQYDSNIEFLYDESIKNIITKKR